MADMYQRPGAVSGRNVSDRVYRQAYEALLAQGRDPQTAAAMATSIGASVPNDAGQWSAPISDQDYQANYGNFVQQALQREQAWAMGQKDIGGGDFINTSSPTWRPPASMVLQNPTQGQPVTMTNQYGRAPGAPAPQQPSPQPGQVQRDSMQFLTGGQQGGQQPAAGQPFRGVPGMAYAGGTPNFNEAGGPPPGPAPQLSIGPSFQPIPPQAQQALGGGMRQSAPLMSGQTSVVAGPEQRQTEIQQMGADLYNQGRGVGYTGPKPVGFDQATLQGQQSVLNAAGGIQGQLPAINKSLNFNLNAADISQNPYAQKAINAALGRATEAYTDPGGVLANIRSGANAAGQYGSSRQGIAEGIAAREYGQTLNDTAASMASSMYNQGLDAQTRALGLSPSILQLQTLPGQLQSSVGAQREGLSQAQENYNAESRNWDINNPWRNLQNYASLVYGGGMPQQQPDNNEWLQALGLGLTGYGMGREMGMGNTGSLLTGGALSLAGFLG